MKDRAGRIRRSGGGGRDRGEQEEREEKRAADTGLGHGELPGYLNRASKAARGSVGLSRSLANSCTVLGEKSGQALAAFFLAMRSGMAGACRHSQRAEVSKCMQFEQVWRAAPQRVQLQGERDHRQQ